MEGLDVDSCLRALFNEEQGIPRLAEKLARLREQLGPRTSLNACRWTIGSRDETLEAVESCFANTPQIVKVAHDRNRGLGAAVLPKFLTAMEKEDADIATGSPYHSQWG